MLQTQRAWCGVIELVPAWSDHNPRSTLLQLLTLMDAGDLQKVSCSETLLQQVFGVSDPATLQEMQRELCNLTSADFASLTRLLSSQIDLKKLLPLVNEHQPPN